jgi:hypothetical protein
MNYYLQTPSSINQKLAIQSTKIMTNKIDILINLKEGKQQNISSSIRKHSRILTCKSILTILSVLSLVLLAVAALILPNILLYRMIPLLCMLTYF